MNVQPRACPSVEDAVKQIKGYSWLPSRIAELNGLLAQIKLQSRPLTSEEVDVFRRNCNRGELLVSCYSNTENTISDLSKIYNCDFKGLNVLFKIENSTTHELDLTSTTFENCVIESGSSVNRSTRVRKCFLRSGSLIEGCGLVSGPAEGTKTRFGNGLKVSPGLGTGERSVQIVCESSLETISRVSLDQYKEPNAKREYDEIISSYCSTCDFEFSIVEEGAVVENCPELIEFYLGTKAKVTGGSRVRKSTLMDGAIVEQGSDVVNSLLQPNSHVSSQGYVQGSIMCTKSSVEVQGKLLGSVLGSGSGVAEGEMSSSLVGPLVGFHHQSMLIASFWPSGRGNVAYGANLGSNHTSRVADQGMWPGEGVFFGLGSCAKFPINMIEASYSVVASGVVFGPGRLNLPFSLVTTSLDGRARISPGWCLASNAYFVERAALKMKTRSPPGYAMDVFRPEIVYQVLKGLSILTKIKEAVNSTEDLLIGERLLDGLFLLGGYITKEDLIKGIKAYTFFLELFALRGVNGPKPSGGDISSLTKVSDLDIASTGIEPSEDETSRAVLIAWSTVFGTSKSQEEVKTLLFQKEQEFTRRVIDSKVRDHTRGSMVFPDGRYDEAIHIDNDPVIAVAKERVQKLQSLNHL